MSTLILTCDTGEGHNSCAKAIKEVYDAKGVPCEIVNPVRFVAEWFAKFVHWTHTTIYQKRPKVFEAGYRFTQKHNGLTTKRGSFPYWVLSFGAKKLHEYIIQNNFTDIICVHPLLMMMVSEQQRKYRLDIPVAFVATDYTCSPGVQDSKPDVCFIPEITLAEEFLCENIRFSQLEASGIPVRQQFYRTVDRKTAKWLSGVPANASHLLMMCGSMGCGPMEEMLDVVSGIGFQCVEVACWPQGKAERRYAGVSHIDVDNTSDEYIAHIVDKKCPAKICKKLMRYTIIQDNCFGCGMCAKACPAGAIIKTEYVAPGKKLPGQMGNVTRTVQNLEVVAVDTTNNLLLIKGSIPGPKKGLVVVKSAIKANGKVNPAAELVINSTEGAE
mgnify:CR=1 FL=1